MLLKNRKLEFKLWKWLVQVTKKINRRFFEKEILCIVFTLNKNPYYQGMEAILKKKLDQIFLMRKCLNFWNIFTFIVQKKDIFIATKIISRPYILFLLLHSFGSVKLVIRCKVTIISESHEFYSWRGLPQSSKRKKTL